MSDKQIIDRLSSAFGGAGIDSVARLQSRLAALAERKGLLDVSYRTIDSPLGSLLLAATGDGLVRVAFSCEGHDAVLARLAGDIGPRILRTPRRLDEAAHQLDEYFAGKRRAFSLPIDLQLAHGFRRSVLEHLRRIPYGVTQSYADVARAAGNPSAVRAAASACSRNPLPLIVPCHRVVRSDGTTGEYLGGPEAKRALLTMEATT
jgi:methylated-DNA-[protein]-cysteine S-methyltransferase